MLTKKQLAIVRAALRYWRDEMVPAGSAAKYYFDRDGVTPSTALDIDALVASFRSEEVWYIELSSDRRGIVTQAVPMTSESKIGTVIFAQSIDDHD